MSDIPTPLNFVNPDDVDSRYRVLLYGQPGAGKSVAAATAPGPVLVLSADRPGAYRYARTRHPKGRIQEVRVEGKRTLEDAYSYVRDGGDVKTVVIDPVGNLYDTLLAEVGGSNPQIQHHGTVQKTILGIVKSFRDLNVNLVLVCHVDVLDSEEGGALRRPATGGQKLPDKVQAEMDIVSYCARVPATGDESERFVGVFVEDRGRVAKDSTNALGRVRDLDLTEWFETATAALAGDPVPFDVTDPEPEPEQQTLEEAAA